MKLRKLLFSMLMVLFLGSSFSSFAEGTNPDVTPVNSKPSTEQLIARLHEIKELTKTNLTSTEKSELRKEVKTIRKELRTTKKSNGVYLSVGAIIIIVLLLLLLL